MKTRKFLVIGIIFMTIAIGFMLYPTVCNAFNSFLSNNTIIEYNNNTNNLSAADKLDYLSAAEEYNDNLACFSYSNTKFNNYANYDDILNFGNGIIGSVKIPKIEVNLPIYHGTSEEVLSKGAGHLPDTAFPIGGIGNHCVISAHTGYPTQKFFDNLNELEPGDDIYICVLDETHVYKVFDKAVVDPEDISLLSVDENSDLLSLITCFPYGINSHRLIVRSERLKEEKINTPDEINNKSDSSDYSTVLYIFILFVLIFTLLIVITIIFNKKRKRRN